jgi:hypothetical protein
MASLTAGTTFTDGVANDVTAAKLGALVTNAIPTSGFIQDRTAETVVAVNDTLLIGDASDSNNLKRMTVANLLKAPLVSTSGTIDALTTGTTTSTAGIVTSGTIATLNSTTGTITNLSATTSTFLGTITGSTNVINIGSGQIYKDASGNVGIGVTSPISTIHAKQATPVSKITLEDLSTNRIGQIGGGSDGSGGFLSFSIGNNGGSITERLRIDSIGNILFGKASPSATVVGAYININGKGLFTSDADAPLYINRLTSDGVLIEFAQASALEGTISVSGNTVSYNPFAGSHWSQLEDGSRPEILRGTVLESINQLCQWPDGGNERFAKCKISDTVVSKKVYGVFLDWDNSWDQTNDLYVTAVGLFVCRINASVTVQIGDLLESNGDGTARVQADDIIRSSTIGKVTSSVKTHEHPDGSYCVPTVLYCG